MYISFVDGDSEENAIGEEAARGRLGRDESASMMPTDLTGINLLELLKNEDVRRLIIDKYDFSLFLELIGLSRSCVCSEIPKRTHQSTWKPSARCVTTTSRV